MTTTKKVSGEHVFGHSYGKVQMSIVRFAGTFKVVRDDTVVAKTNTQSEARIFLDAFIDGYKFSQNNPSNVSDKNQQLRVPLTAEDLEDLRNGEYKDWIFNTNKGEKIDITLFSAEEE